MLVKKEQPYAQTEVPVERTKAQIERMLLDAGAEAVRITTMATGEVTVEFVLETKVGGIQKKFGVQLKSPLIERERGTKYNRFTERDQKAEVRMLHWYLKSLLEAAQYGLMSVERIFFSHIMFHLSDGSTATAGEMAAQALIGGNPALLPGAMKDGD